MNPVVIHLAISRDILLTSNQRLNRWEKARRTRAIRDMANVMCRYTRARLMQAATLEVVVKWPDHRRRDAANLEPTGKAAIDGCVDAGLLPDDSDKHLRKVSYSSSDERTTIPGVACTLTLTFTPIEGAA